MKTRLIIILTFLSSFTVNGQYDYEYKDTIITTPTGVLVDALKFKYWIYDDFTPEEKAGVDYQMTKNYNCEIISSSTKYYNCHGYAWHNVNGNMAQDKLVWINDIDYNYNPTYNVHRYYSAEYSDGKPSYKQIAANNKANLKVSYFPRDHSAITTSNPTYLISKWSWGPLVKHTISQCPFYNNAQIKYYAPINTISGSNIICFQSIYTIEKFQNLQSGASVTWSASNSNLQLVSGQGTSTAVFQKNGNGACKVEANISVNGISIIQLEKRVWAGKPQKPSNIVGFPYNGMNFGSNSYYNFRISLPNQGASSYEWSVGGGTIVSGQGTNWITVLTGNANSGNNIYFNVDVKAVNDCGCSPIFLRTGYVVKGEGPAYKVYPNPANDYVVISFDQQSMREYAERKGQKAQGCELVVYNDYNQIMYKTRTSEDEIQIDTRNFPAGTYYLHVTYGDKTEKSQLVIE